MSKPEKRKPEKYEAQRANTPEERIRRLKFWRRWSQSVVPALKPVLEIPPFIYSDTQCRKCGKQTVVDGQRIDLLTLDEKWCLICFERHHVTAYSTGIL